MFKHDCEVHCLIQSDRSDCKGSALQLFKLTVGIWMIHAPCTHTQLDSIQPHPNSRQHSPPHCRPPHQLPPTGLPLAVMRGRLNRARRSYKIL